jgi:RHS repeat-associated protein
VTTDLYYSDAWQVLEERVGGQTMVQYVWSPVYVDALILRDRDTNGDGTLDERLWVVQDANYNVTALLDNSGNVVERYIYDPFGSVTVLDANWVERSAGSQFAWHYLHQGGRYDDVSGLYHFRYRDYSPTLGRWTSLDPIRYEAGDVNLYRTVCNAPTVYVDPFGLDNDIPDAVAVPLPGPLLPVHTNLLSYGPRNFWDWLANDVIGTDNVRSWDAVLGHHRTGWFAQTSNFAAGMGDTLSFGATSYIRQGLGYDDVVDYHSTAYFGGQVVGTGYSFVLGWYAAAPVPASGVWAYRITQGYTVAGSVYGVGHSSYVLATDPQNFGFTDVLGFIPLAGYGSRRLLYIRFYRGSTAYDVVETVQNQAVSIERLIARQSNAPTLDLGPGLYLTRSRQTAKFFADKQGAFGRQGCPAVLGAEINRFRRWWLRWHYGARGNVPISRMPGHYQDHVPYEGINYFNRYAYFWQERIRWAQPIR